ncbi:hypothetical protein PIB30_021330 [Stylosanthes scabra]|uniref:Uncharacterized protein n=1 Tax=Stylosanthes scabra TaxID=79078 RepID=A0ABU6Q8L2_9FABA|nr:hypothetical protein [Stylosanthes scabra]
MKATTEKKHGKWRMPKRKKKYDESLMFQNKEVKANKVKEESPLLSPIYKGAKNEETLNPLSLHVLKRHNVSGQIKASPPRSFSKTNTTTNIRNDKCPNLGTSESAKLEGFGFSDLPSSGATVPDIGPARPMSTTNPSYVGPKPTNNLSSQRTSLT